MDKRDAGRAGEDFAAGYYENQGFRIIGRNYHSRFGELDIIAESREILAFVEVKTRFEGSFLPAREAVDTSKQRKCVLTALKFLSEYETSKQLRFDIMEVLHNGKRLTSYRFTPDAFQFDENMLKNVYY